MTTFKVKQCVGNKQKNTTITIHDDHIMESKKPILKFKSLRQIVIMDADKKKYRECTFTLMRGKDDKELSSAKFMAKNEDKRNEILMAIFGKLPPNEVNRGHWKSLMSATEKVVVDIDHSSPRTQAGAKSSTRKGEESRRRRDRVKFNKKEKKEEKELFCWFC